MIRRLQDVIVKDVAVAKQFLVVCCLTQIQILMIQDDEEALMTV